MHESTTVYAPRIRVSGILLERQNDGSYTANLVRPETTLGESVQSVKGEWGPRTWRVPWDMRVDQQWLRMYPSSWEPAS
jgi:hypothetical protein